MKIVRSPRWISAVLACIMLTACGAGSSGVDIDYNDPLAGKLSAPKDNGKTAPLNTLTDFGWDEVHLFHEGTPREVIEDVVGESLIAASSTSPQRACWCSRSRAG